MAESNGLWLAYAHQIALLPVYPWLGKRSCFEREKLLPLSKLVLFKWQQPFKPLLREGDAAFNRIRMAVFILHCLVSSSYPSKIDRKSLKRWSFPNSIFDQLEKDIVEQEVKPMSCKIRTILRLRMGRSSEKIGLSKTWSFSLRWDPPRFGSCLATVISA